LPYVFHQKKNLEETVMTDQTLALLYASPSDDAAWMEAVSKAAPGADIYRLAKGQLIGYQPTRFTHLALLEPAVNVAAVARSLRSRLGTDVTEWSFTPITHRIERLPGDRTGRHVLPTLTRPVEGRIDALDHWYTNHHVPEVVQVPEFVAGRRYRAIEQTGEGPRLEHVRLALYEIEGEDPEPSLRRLEAALAGMVQTDALEMNTIASWCFSPLES
jgi:hypothetical protein